MLNTDFLFLLKGKNKPPVAGSAVESGGTVKDKEPPLWKWEKQDLERQINELKRKIEESSLGEAKKIKTKKVSIISLC